MGRCLSSQTLPESELRFLTRVDSEAGSYGEMTGTYAFVENRQQPGEGQIQEEAVYEACNREIQILKEQGILPGEVKGSVGRLLRSGDLLSHRCFGAERIISRMEDQPVYGRKECG